MATNLQIVPASKSDVEAQIVEMMVPLHSFGCKRKVKKALSHLKGIYSVNVDYEQQKVIVWGICNKCDVLSAIKNKRKEARFWDSEDSIAIAEAEVSRYSSSSISSPPALTVSAKFASSRSAKLLSFKAFEMITNAKLQCGKIQRWTSTKAKRTCYMKWNKT
ncbi:hypothetical protein Droror1_Dr00013033 [Drosera rotundifolia]